MEIIKEFYQYFKDRKKIWLAPVIILLLIIGIILIIGGSSVLGPFIYTIF